MKRTLLMMAACMLALAGCKKEDAGTTAPTGGDGLITEISATSALGTKVLIEPNVFIPEMDSEGDRLTWVAGDEIAFWELEPIANISNTAGSNSPGYMPKNQKQIIFTLVSGAGTKRGVFAPKTAGEGLNPDGLYVATHCSTPSRVSLQTSSAGGDAGMSHRLRFASNLNYSINNADEDIVSANSTFWSKVNIVDGEVEPLSFMAVHPVMEFQLWQDEASLEGDYTITEVRMRNTKKTGYGGTFYFFYNANVEYNFNPDFELNIKNGSSYNESYVALKYDVALSKDESNPTIIRMPFHPRQNPGNGAYAGGGEVAMDIVVTLKSASGTTVKKTFAGVKKGNADSENVAFPAGRTYYRTFTVDSAN